MNYNPKNKYCCPVNIKYYYRAAIFVILLNSGKRFFQNLTQTLRTLEQDGYVSRVVFAEVPPRVEYHITSLGDSFMDACRPMVDWAIAHFAEVIKNRSPYIQNADNT